MKTINIYIIISLLVFVDSYCFSQNTANAFAGKNGIFINCGDSIPKSFTYQIDRKKNSSDSWEKIAACSFPKNYTEFKSRVLNDNNGGIAYHTETDEQLKKKWTEIQNGTTASTLKENSVNTLYLSAIGIGFWDLSIDSSSNYQYRIQKLKSNQSYNESLIPDIRFPGKAPYYRLKLSKKESNFNEISLDFLLENYQKIFGFKVFRSSYLQNDFMEIFPEIGYTNSNEGKHLIIQDNSVTDKAQYSYKIIPFDYFGNEGLPSEIIDIYNATKYSLTTKISNFDVQGIDNENAIKLSWNLIDKYDVISIDIYRGGIYDGYYAKIGSALPNESFFLDKSVNAMKTYYYSLVINTSYGRTYPSMRANGMLNANKANFFPPKNLTVEKINGVAKLSWENSGRETKGYYVYRSFQYTDTPMQISTFIPNSRDSIITYTDSLKNITDAAVIMYAVTDENLSYNQSPLSEKVAIEGIAKTLPVAYPLETKLIDEKVLLLWKDYFADYPALIGFNIYRKTLNDDNKLVEDWKKISFTNYGINSFRDNTVNEGMRYLYAIEAVGIYENETGTKSPEIDILIPEILPISPPNVKAMALNSEILIEWDQILDKSLDKIMIYRAELEKENVLLKEISPESISYSDKTVQAKTTYFYTIITESKSGKKCKYPASIGIRSKE
ncbi:MAG: hypothetical protein HXX18_04030 [Bacteroidetes bacterium]|nr:hypothetical protein [Bacteroidota bacterium]